MDSFAEVSFLPQAQTSTNLSLVTVVILEQAETKYVLSIDLIASLSRMGPLGRRTGRKT